MNSQPGEILGWLNEMASAQDTLTDVKGHRPGTPDREKREIERRRRILSALLQMVPEAAIELAFRAHPKGGP